MPHNRTQKEIPHKFFIVTNINYWNLLSKIHGHSHTLILLKRHIPMLTGAYYLAREVADMSITAQDLKVLIDTISKDGFASVTYRK